MSPRPTPPPSPPSRPGLDRRSDRRRRRARPRGGLHQYPHPGGDHRAAGAPGGNLVVGMTSDPNTLLPWKATQFQAVNILQNVYGTLTEFDKDLNVVSPARPVLGRLGRRQDRHAPAAFRRDLHRRQPVRLADVKASLDRIMDEKTAAVARTSPASVASVAAPDPATVVLTMKSADASLPANLASVNLAMLSSTDTDEKPGDDPQRHRAVCVQGTDPEPVAQPAEERVLLGHQGHPGQLEFRVIPDETSIVSSLQSGNVQMAVIDDPLVAKTAEGGTLKVAKTPRPGYHVLHSTPARVTSPT